MRNRPGFFLGEALRSLRANLATTIAATVTVLIVMYLSGVGLALGSWVYNYTDRVKQDLTLQVFLADSATPAQKAAIGKKLKEDSRVDRASVVFVSKDDAYKRMQKRLGEQNETLDYVPPGIFPASWEAKAADADDLPVIAASFKGIKGLDPDPTQDNPNYGGDTSDRVLTTAKWVAVTIGLITSILVVAAVLLIGNTIRLSIFARRREVEVMKLVGATNWFVRWPFVLEGIICGAIGSGAAIALLVASSSALDRMTGNGDSLFEGSGTGSIAMPTLAAILMLLGLGLGAAGSALTMRRFLRV